MSGTGTSTLPLLTATNARLAKSWISDYGFEATRHAFDKSAANWGIDQLDLLILHLPLPTAFDRTRGLPRP